MELLKTTLKLARIENALFPLVSLVAGAIFGGTSPDSIWLYIAAIIIFLLHSAVTIWNDLCDYEVDAKNGRPFIAKIRGSPLYSQIVVITVLIIVISLGLSAAISWTAFFIVSAAIVVSWLYNARPYSGSRRPLASIILLSGTSSFIPFILGFTIVGGWAEALLLGNAWWIMRISLSILKDYKDAHGDASSAKRTFLLTYGSSNVRTVSILTFVAGQLALIFLMVYVLSASWLIGVVASVITLVFAGYRFHLLRPRDYALMHRNFVTIANYHLVIEAGLIAWILYF